MPVQSYRSAMKMNLQSLQYPLAVEGRTHPESSIEKKLDTRSKFLYAGTRLFQHFILHIKTPSDK